MARLILRKVAQGVSMKFVMKSLLALLEYSKLILKCIFYPFMKYDQLGTNCRSLTAYLVLGATFRSKWLEIIHFC